MSSPGLVFHRFRDLPPELRLAIWRECLPSRVVELYAEPDDIIWDDHPFPCARNDLIQLRNSAPPLLTRVCHESRAVAFETGGLLPEVADPNVPDIQAFAQYMIEKTWIDAERDVAVHLNWNSWADIEWQTYDRGDPVRCMMAYARIGRRQASIMLDLLRCLYSVPEERHPHDRWTRSEVAKLMRKRRSWTVVILPPVAVHDDAGAVAATGLFGLLNDAPVQLVDADDVTKVHEFLRLGEVSGVSVGPSFGPDQVSAFKGELWLAVENLFGSQNAAPIMHPVVMFRLCTSKCA